MSAGDPDARALAAARAGANGGSSQGRGLSHASVTELELKFAQNPRSDAYIALCEAYLTQGRFMEAMVVAKKGIKAHPGAVEAMLLLSRVYAAQKKFPRALQTLAAAIAAHPDDPRVYSLRARVKLAGADKDGAIQDLKRAIDLDPNHREALVQLDALGIAPPNTNDLSTNDVEVAAPAAPNPAWSPAADLETIKTPVRSGADLTYHASSELTGDMTGDFVTGDFSSDLLTPAAGGFGPPGQAPDPSFGFTETPGESLTFGEPGLVVDGPPGGLAFSDAPRNEFDFAGTFGEQGDARSELEMPAEPATFPPFSPTPTKDANAQGPHAGGAPATRRRRGARAARRRSRQSKREPRSSAHHHRAAVALGSRWGRIRRSSKHHQGSDRGDRTDDRGGVARFRTATPTPDTSRQRPSSSGSSRSRTKTTR